MCLVFKFTVMNKEEEYTYLQNIEEYIFEENKIVTYQWLCKTLDIHVNQSKQLLYTFATQGSKKDEVSITYLLAGVLKDGTGHHVTVVKDENLVEAKKCFRSITSEHVYSVQKRNSVSDLNVLYTVDNSDEHKLNNYKRLSSIDFESVERDSTTLAVLRAESLPIVSKQPIAALKKPTAKPKSPKKQISPKKQSSPVKPVSPKKGNVKNPVKENDNKPTVASMFAKAAANKKTPSASNTAPKTAKDNKPKPSGIGAFFNKAPPKPKEVVNNDINRETVTKMKMDKLPVVPTKEIGKENNTKNKIVVEDKIDNDSKEEISIKSQTKKRNTKQSQSISKVKGSKGIKRTKQHNDEEKVVKKRKRILVISESESSSDDDSDPIAEREPTPPSSPTVVEDDDEDVIQGTPQPVSRKRTRHLVDRTYTDSEGYMYTKKEYVVDSCSDEEDSKETKENNQLKEEEKEKVNVQDNSKVQTSKTVSKKQKSPQKTKQTNLMSFFGKK